MVFVEFYRGSMMNIDVIGGSGFIGTSICKLLSNKGVSFSILDKNHSSSFPDHVKIVDVRSLDNLRHSISEGGVIINLAAEHRDDVRPKSLYHEVNVKGAENICTIAREKHVNTIIFTSTVAVYGFAPIGTDETGRIAPFNEYGHSKYDAEQIFKLWQMEAPEERTLVIVRPTVIFGERNRGNVYNLLKQISSGRFLMVGKGMNRKSMGYVENIAAFLEYSIPFRSGVYIYNYIDKPDFDMNTLVGKVNCLLERKKMIGFHLPYWLGFTIGKGFDLLSVVTGKQFTISSIRVKKFCSNSVYNTAIEETGFVPPVLIDDALAQTIRYEFIEGHCDEQIFYSE